MIKKGLGKGLEALISTEGNDEKGILELKITDIEPSSEQPRKLFDDEKLIQLSESIKQHGVVQPLIVKKEGGLYKIVAGERRWRASRLAGLKTVPVIIKDFSKRQVMEIALIENLQREDLNPIEEAEAYEKLINEFNLTQDEISRTVGKSRPAIANSIRLLTLDDKIRGMVISGFLSSGHARALLAVEDLQTQLKLAEEISKKGLNVRDTEKLVKRTLSKGNTVKVKKLNVEYAAIQDKLKDLLGTKVELLVNKKKGKIMIEYYSVEELERIVELIEQSSRK